MTRRVLIRAGRVVDSSGRGGGGGPGALLLEGSRVIAAGTPAGLGTPGAAQVRRLPGHVVMPALVNSHCHLDLSHLAPRPFGGDFLDWIDSIRGARGGADSVARSVSRGIELVVAGGTAAVGDIAGRASTEPLAQLQRSGLRGVSFAEVLGIGRRRARAMSELEGLSSLPADPGGDGPCLGVSPHAPYSCAIEVYRRAVALGRPLATHLAETQPEIEFTTTAGGPLADFLRRIDRWDETIRPFGGHPVEALGEVLTAAPWVAAHVNYVEDRHLEMLASWRTTVAYCPRAAAYFGHRDHRYRDMIAAGVNVALGSDALASLDTPDRISVLDDMRYLYRRDGTAVRMLLHMATSAGAAGLGMDEGLFSFAPGPIAGVIALPFDPADPRDPLAQVMGRDDAPQWIVAPGRGRGIMPVPGETWPSDSSTTTAIR